MDLGIPKTISNEYKRISINPSRAINLVTATTCISFRMNMKRISVKLMNSNQPKNAYKIFIETTCTCSMDGSLCLDHTYGYTYYEHL